MRALAQGMLGVLGAGGLLLGVLGLGVLGLGTPPPAAAQFYDVATGRGLPGPSPRVREAERALQHFREQQLQRARQDLRESRLDADLRRELAELRAADTPARRDQVLQRIERAEDRAALELRLETSELARRMSLESSEAARRRILLDHLAELEIQRRRQDLWRPLSEVDR